MDLNTLKLNQSAIFESEKIFMSFTKKLIVNQNFTKVFVFSVKTISKKNGNIGIFPNIEPKEIKNYSEELIKINELKFKGIN